jgi:hypothetical protein
MHGKHVCDLDRKIRGAKSKLIAATHARVVVGAVPLPCSLVTMATRHDSIMGKHQASMLHIQERAVCKYGESLLLYEHANTGTIGCC